PRPPEPGATPGNQAGQPGPPQPCQHARCGTDPVRRRGRVTKDHDSPVLVSRGLAAAMPPGRAAAGTAAQYFPRAGAAQAAWANIPPTVTCAARQTYLEIGRLTYLI